MRGELILLRSEIEELKHVAEKVLLSHFPFSFYIENFHPLDQLVEDLKKCRIISFTNTRPSEYSNVVSKQSYKIKF